MVLRVAIEDFPLGDVLVPAGAPVICLIGAVNRDPAHIGAGPLMAAGALPDPDRGCIIAVIDDAIPFAHQHLRLPGALSRVASLWVQDARVDPDGPGRDLPWGI